MGEGGGGVEAGRRTREELKKQVKEGQYMGDIELLKATLQAFYSRAFHREVTVKGQQQDESLRVAQEHRGSGA